MALKIKLSQKMVQKMALTPQMRQSIHILQLPLLELKDYLEQQIEENPTLEDARDLELMASLSDEKLNKLLERREEYKGDFETVFNAGYSQEEAQKKQNYRESLITKGPTLQEHLIRQLRMQSLNKTDYKIAELLISHIDENGYFQSSAEEIAQTLASKGIEVSPQDVDNILCLIQTFEPIGTGARDLKECLIIQLKAKGKQDSLCYQIVEHHLPDLARNKLKVIAKSLKVPLIQVKEVSKEISRLEPKPGRLFTQTETRRILARPPDIIVEKIDNQYEIIVNNRELPKLKISAHYKNLLSRKDTSEETKKYLKEKINSALWLIKAVAQRQDTIRRIAECIIGIQGDFFEQGQEERLKPLTLQEVAQRVERNESTISRVVNNKYIQTPYGIFKLNYFFSGSYKTEQGLSISSEAIKSQIINLIDEEDHRHPLSDDKIVKSFKAQGINIARRTIAKYREELKIPPSHLRKE
jgi:RNA polymerase sigma-54 factor